MSQVRIQTVHNVTIDFEVASVGERILAVIIDWLVIVGYILCIAFLLGAMDFEGESIPLVIFILLPFLMYPFLCEYFLGGQTFGKKAMKIKVVKIDGTQPGLSNYLMRWLIGLIERNLFAGLIAILSIAIGGKGQRLGDMAANTMVVRVKRLGDFNKTPFVDQEDTYQPRYGVEVLNLNDHDVSTIRKILNVVDRERSLPPNIAEILQKAKENVENVLQLSSSQTPLEFLRQVIRDYFTIGIGISSAFYLKNSEHNKAYPWLKQHKAAYIFPEFALGYYLNNPDLQINLSYRKIKSDLTAFGRSQLAKRKALTLEAYKFLGDYHGFVPFLGASLSYERLSFSESDSSLITGKYEGERIKPGFIFGWDIRPDRLQSFYLRTNLRWAPDLSLNTAAGKKFRFDQLEINFIELVIFPGRFFSAL